jgi:phosphopantetheine adenylyltransferase
MSKKELERIKKEYSSQLKPLIDSAIKMRRTPKISRALKENLLKIKTQNSKIDQTYNYMAQQVDILEEELSTVPESSVRFFFSIAFFYLGIVEMTGNFLADFVIAHLIATGHDFHIECTYRTPRIKHVVYLKELEEERVSLATKLNFIEDCGITIFRSIINTRLRNDIAHMNFDIKQDTVYIRGKPAIEMINSSIFKMLAALDAHESLMKEAILDLDVRMSSLKKAFSNHEPK